jgi:hypothetical protein
VVIPGFALTGWLGMSTEPLKRYQEKIFWWRKLKQKTVDRKVNFLKGKTFGGNSKKNFSTKNFWLTKINLWKEKHFRCRKQYSGKNKFEKK